MQSKGRTKLFIENFLVYGVGSMMSKLIPLIMLPIIADLYPSSLYLGLNDLSQNFISFAAALAVCGMYDAMFRLFFDNKDEVWQKKVCSTAFTFVSVMSVVMSVVLFIFRRPIASWYFDDVKYEGLVVLTIIGFLVNSTNQIISAPTRIQNKRKIFLITNTLSPFISYLVAIPLVLQGHYVIAMPVATIMAFLTVETAFFVMNRKFFNPKNFDKSVLKSLFAVGLPLLPNFIIYWIYNSSANIIISKMMGTEFTGIYGVGARIGHVSNLIYTAFASGWLYFAYSTMNDDDQVQMKSNIFEYMGAISFAATSALMSVSYLGIDLLFSDVYIDCHIIAPYLFLAPLLLMLYQIIANQFTIVKKTYMNLLSLLIGAIVYIVLSLVLIKKIGMEGAAIATVAGYMVSIIMCLFWLRRMKLIVINKKVYVNAAVIIGYFLVWRLLLHENIVLSAVSGIAVMGIYVLLYKNMIMDILKKRRKK